MSIHNKYKYITNPKTKRKVLLRGKMGQSILSNYLNNYQHNFQKGGDASKLTGTSDVPVSNKDNVVVPPGCALSAKCGPSQLNPTAKKIHVSGHSTKQQNQITSGLHTLQASIENSNACIKHAP